MPIWPVVGMHRLTFRVSTVVLLICLGWIGFYFSVRNENPGGSTKSSNDLSLLEQASTPEDSPISHKVAVSPMPTINPESWKRASRGMLLRTWQKLVDSTDLTDLKYKRLKPGDIEIRIWSLPGFAITKDKCWVFMFKAGRWEGYMIVDHNLDGRITKEKLSPPSDDWGKWNTYVANTITPAKIRELPIDKVSSNDGTTMGLEVEYGTDYEMAFIANDDFERELIEMLKSEFLNNDQTY